MTPEECTRDSRANAAAALSVAVLAAFFNILRRAAALGSDGTGECAVTRINVTIAVAGDARGRLYEVATVCRALGFGHTSTRSDLGVLVGSAELEDLPSLRAVPGVISIEMEERRTARGSRRLPPVRTRRGASLRLRGTPARES